MLPDLGRLALLPHPAALIAAHEGDGEGEVRD
jgi:hypothetical protein